MNFQIRLTEGDTSVVKHFFSSYIEQATKVMIFKHSPPRWENGIKVYVNEHHHVYLFNLQKTPNGIRDYCRRYYEKTKFAIATTAGGHKKIELTPEGAFQYGTTKDKIEPVFMKGFEEHEIEEYRIRAAVHYAPQPTKLQTGDAIVVVKEQTVIKQDRVWERLKDDIDRYKGKSIVEIKRNIAAQYLNNGRALPRNCDLHRYASSLYYILRHEGKEIEENDLKYLYEN